VDRVGRVEGSGGVHAVEFAVGVLCSFKCAGKGYCVLAGKLVRLCDVLGRHEPVTQIWLDGAPFWEECPKVCMEVWGVDVACQAVAAC
jgi:hypothetical protein